MPHCSQVLFPLLFIRTISKLTFILPGLWAFPPQLSAFSHRNGHEFKSQSQVIGGLTLPLRALMILHVLHFYCIESTYPSWSLDCVLFFFEAMVSHSPGYQKTTLFYLFKRKPLCAALLKHCSPFTGPIITMWDSSMPPACPFFIFVWVVNSLGNRLSVQSVLIQTYRWFFALAYDTELFCCCSSALALVLEASADSCILLTYFHCCMFRSCVPLFWPYKILHAHLARLLPQFWKELLHEDCLRNQDLGVSCAW